MKSNAMIHTARERFYKHFKKHENGCWIWTANKAGKYGQLAYGTTSKYAHRLSYELHVGEIPKGMCVCHKCDTPLCVNPEHLFLGTVKDNNYDCMNKGRAAIGEKAGKVKLKESEVLEILKMSERGIIQIDIATKFNISRQQVSYIKLNKAWKHIKR